MSTSVAPFAASGSALARVRFQTCDLVAGLQQPLGHRVAHAADADPAEPVTVRLHPDAVLPAGRGQAAFPFLRLCKRLHIVAHRLRLSSRGRSMVRPAGKMKRRATLQGRRRSGRRPPLDGFARAQPPHAASAHAGGGGAGAGRSAATSTIARTPRRIRSARTAPGRSESSFPTSPTRFFRRSSAASRTALAKRGYLAILANTDGAPRPRGGDRRSAARPRRRRADPRERRA